MRTRQPYRGKPPGQLDVHHCRIPFPSTNVLGIPDMARSDFVPTALLPFGQWSAWERAPRGAACHHFLDDYRFESQWNNPERHLQRLYGLDGVITPDFSVFTDWPDVVNRYQTYRNRWLGCFWQSKGLTVIPSVSWSTVDSLEYAFLGIPKGSVVAIQTQCLDAKDVDEWLNFQCGFVTLVDEIQPEAILCYGKMNPATAGFDRARVIEYPTFWDGRKPECPTKGKEQRMGKPGGKSPAQKEKDTTPQSPPPSRPRPLPLDVPASPKSAA